MTGRIPRLAGGVLGAFLPQPSVPKEQRLRQSFGFRTRAGRTAEGWLVLTEHEVVFERSVPVLSFARLLPNPNVRVDIGEIVSLERRSGELGDRMPFAPVIEVTTASGDAFCFQVTDADQWLSELRDRTGLPGE